MKNQILLSLAGAIIGVSSLSSQTITGFGSGDFTETYQDFTSIAQTASTYQVIGTDFGSSLYGSFNSVALAGAPSTLRLVVTGTLATAITSNFNVELYDNVGNIAVYSSNWSGFSIGSPSSRSISYVSSDVGFNGVAVVSLGIITGGTGSSLTFTFDTLSAQPIPEPSTFMAIAGLGAMGYTVTRRRRSTLRVLS